MSWKFRKRRPGIWNRYLHKAHFSRTIWFIHSADERLRHYFYSCTLFRWELQIWVFLYHSLNMEHGNPTETHTHTLATTTLYVREFNWDSSVGRRCEFLPTNSGKMHYKRLQRIEGWERGLGTSSVCVMTAVNRRRIEGVKLTSVWRWWKLSWAGCMHIIQLHAVMHVLLLVFFFAKKGEMHEKER